MSETVSEPGFLREHCCLVCEECMAAYEEKQADVERLKELRMAIEDLQSDRADVLRMRPAVEAARRIRDGWLDENGASWTEREWDDLDDTLKALDRQEKGESELEDALRDSCLDAQEVDGVLARSRQEKGEADG